MDGFEDIAQVIWLVTWEYLWGEDTEITVEHETASIEFVDNLYDSFQAAFPNAEVSIMTDAAQYASQHSRIYANDDVPWERLDDAYTQALCLMDDLYASEWWAARIEGLIEEVAA